MTTENNITVLDKGMVVVLLFCVGFVFVLQPSIWPVAFSLAFSSLFNMLPFLLNCLFCLWHMTWDVPIFLFSCFALKKFSLFLADFSWLSSLFQQVDRLCDVKILYNQASPFLSASWFSFASSLSRIVQFGLLCRVTLMVILCLCSLWTLWQKHGLIIVNCFLQKLVSPFWQTVTIVAFPSGSDRLPEHQQVPEPAAGHADRPSERSLWVLQQHPVFHHPGRQAMRPLGHGHSG